MRVHSPQFPIVISFLTTFCSVKVCGLPEVSPPENLTLEAGQTASFLCVVDMTCMVSYVEWYRHSDNGTMTTSTLITEPLTITESVILLRRGTDPGDPYRYRIESVGPEDSGLYTCLAGNILGETKHSAYLTVSSGPSDSLPLPTFLLFSLCISIQFSSESFQSTLH